MLQLAFFGDTRELENLTVQSCNKYNMYKLVQLPGITNLIMRNSSSSEGRTQLDNQGDFSGTKLLVVDAILTLSSQYHTTKHILGVN